VSGKYILNDKGEPELCEDVQAWGKWFEETGSRVVARDTIGESEVSTVFLSLDYSLEGPPLLYQTLVFGGPLADEMERYSTREEAEKGHEAMVERVKAVGEK
jgi:hypothetical protein